MATQVKYVDLEALKLYDSKLKAYLATQDAETLKRAKVTIQELPTPTAGSAITYEVFQDSKYVLKSDGTTAITVEQYNALVDAYKADQKLDVPTGIANPAGLYDVETASIGKIEIPLDESVESGSVVTTPARTETDGTEVPAKTEIVLVKANTVDASTTSGKEEVRIDISSIAGDVSELTTKVAALEATHATKLDADGKTVLQTVEEEIVAKAKTGEYKAESVAGAGDGETIEDALKRFENDLTFKGEATSMPTAPAKGDLYNFNIPATDPDGIPESGDETAAVIGWKFYDGANWQVLSDASLADRVGVLEGQVGKDKTVNAYGSGASQKKDLVDIVNALTADVTTEGSVLKAVYDNAAAAKYGEVEVEDVAGNKPGDPGYTSTKKDISIKEAIENMGEASIADAKLSIDTTDTESGYLKTYAFYQGLKGTETNAEKAAKLVGKVNIPKDFIVKSGNITVFDGDATDGYTQDGAPIAALPTGVSAVGKYLALVLNVVEDTDLDSDSNPDTADQTLYIAVNELVDVYTVKSATDVAADKDEVQLALSDTLELSATLVDGTIARKKIDSAFEKDIKDIEEAIGTHKVGEDTDGNDILELFKVAERISAEAKDAVYKAAVEEHGTVGDPDYVAPLPAVSIAEAIAALEASASDTNGALVFKGTVAKADALPVDAAKGDTYKVTDELAVYTKIESGWERIANSGEFSVNGATVNIKKYIDSRIFVGTEQEINDAKTAGDIDETTFVVEVNEDGEVFEPITEADIDELFN